GPGADRPRLSRPARLPRCRCTSAPHDAPVSAVPGGRRGRLVVRPLSRTAGHGRLSLQHESFLHFSGAPFATAPRSAPCNDAVRGPPEAPWSHSRLTRGRKQDLLLHTDPSFRNLSAECRTVI